MADMTYQEFLNLDRAHRKLAAHPEEGRMREAWDAALGGSAGLTIEEWVAQFGMLRGVTITQVIMSRRAAAMIETMRPLLGKRLSIRVRRRWQGRARAWLRRTAWPASQTGTASAPPRSAPSPRCRPTNAAPWRSSSSRRPCVSRLGRTE